MIFILGCLRERLTGWHYLSMWMCQSNSAREYWSREYKFPTNLVRIQDQEGRTWFCCGTKLPEKVSKGSSSTNSLASTELICLSSTLFSVVSKQFLIMHWKIKPILSKWEKSGLLLYKNISKCPWFLWEYAGKTKALFSTGTGSWSWETRFSPPQSAINRGGHVKRATSLPHSTQDTQGTQCRNDRNSKCFF